MQLSRYKMVCACFDIIGFYRMVFGPERCSVARTLY